MVLHGRTGLATSVVFYTKQESLAPVFYRNFHSVTNLYIGQGVEGRTLANFVPPQPNPSQFLKQ